MHWGGGYLCWIHSRLTEAEEDEILTRCASVHSSHNTGTWCSVVVIDDVFLYFYFYLRAPSVRSKLHRTSIH